MTRGSAAAPCGKALPFRPTVLHLIARLRLAPEAQPQRNQKQPRKGTALPHCPAAQPQRHRAAQSQNNLAAKLQKNGRDARAPSRQSKGCELSMTTRVKSLLPPCSGAWVRSGGPEMTPSAPPRVASASAHRKTNTRRFQISNQRRHPPWLAGIRWRHCSTSTVKLYRMFLLIDF